LPGGGAIATKAFQQRVAIGTFRELDFQDQGAAVSKPLKS
jgi:hypothetical protein